MATKLTKPFSKTGGITPTADYIAYHGALSPNKIAVVDSKKAITFGQFDRDVEKFILTAQKFGLKVGAIVAIEWTDLYEHWLFLIAFEALGITTISYTSSEIEEYWADFDQINLVICSTKFTPPPGKEYQFLTVKWLNDIFTQEIVNPVKRAALNPETILRIHCSSGTTGIVKKMQRSASVNEFRVNQFQFKEGYNKNSQFLFTNGFSVQAAYGRATACIRMGGKCIISLEAFFPEFSKHDITHICSLPYVFEKALTKIPKSYKRPKVLSVSTFGGPVSKHLRQVILKNFGTDLIESYGTNEVGSICTKNINGTATLLPNVTVEVLDDNGKAVFDKVGVIRVQSQGMIDGYLDDIASTKKMFKSGWFYPGDLGLMIDAKTIKILGRVDDQLNIGGIKINPIEYEEKIIKQISVTEICFSAVADRYGVNEVWIAVTPNGTMTLHEIQKIVTPRLPRILGVINYVKIMDMPKTSTGKLKRKEIAKLIAEKVSKPKPVVQKQQIAANKKLN